MSKVQLRKQCQTCQHFDWQLHKSNSFFCAMHPSGQINCPDYEVNLEKHRRLLASKRARERSQQISVIKLTILSLIVFSLFVLSAISIKVLSSLSLISFISSLNSNQILGISLIDLIDFINQIYLIFSYLTIPFCVGALKRKIKHFKSRMLVKDVFSSLLDIFSLSLVMILLTAVSFVNLTGTYFQIEPVFSFVYASICFCLITLLLSPQLLTRYLLKILDILGTICSD